MTFRPLASAALSLTLVPIAFAQAPMPGNAPEHKVLERLVGTWSFEFTDHISAEKPVTMSGIDKAESVCDGKWILGTVFGTSGPLSGMWLTGWDAIKGKYVSVWIDSESPAPSIMMGSFDEESDTFTMRGEMATPEGKISTRSVMSWTDEDTRVEKIFVGEGDDEMLGMELHMTRMKDDAKVAMPAAIKRDKKLDKIPAHELLAKFAGNWTAKVTMTMPGMPAMEPTSMDQIESLVCEGTWSHSLANGNFMGMPYEGRGLVGYDSTSDEYVSIWIDNFSPKITILRGTSDKTGKVITYKGKTVGPTGQMCDTTNKITYKDANRWILEMTSFTEDGKDAGTMTMDYTRNKK